MGLFDFFKGKQPEPAIEVEAVSETPAPQAAVINDSTWGGGYPNTVIPVFFNGEKELGDIGNIRNYIMDFRALRMRSHQLFVDSDVCQALFNRSVMWGIGNGLTLQACPLLEATNSTTEVEDFNEKIEALFSIFASTPLCDYHGVNNLGAIASEAWVNKDVGGDVLVIMRLVNGTPKVQLIDGLHVQTPLLFGTGTGIDVINPETKNIVRHGVEIDKTGKHVAYYVYTTGEQELLGSYERIPARMDKYPYSETARLIYGLKNRIDNTRGIPLITGVMDTVSLMSRYRTATLGSAEETSKISYQIVHQAFSDGSNPVISQATQASGFGNGLSGLPTDSMGEALANKVVATTGKQIVNNPLGAEIKPMTKNDAEVNFKDFYSVNFDLVCAVVGYPPEVIMSKYNSNYSASRAAIKDFEHTVEVKRNQFSSQFYQLIYNFCLDVWVLQGKVELDGYEAALTSRDELSLAAFRKCTFEGDAIPHIDPYKEVQAVRAMLPEDCANLPLITIEQAVRRLGNGDAQNMLEQWEKEWKEVEGIGIKKVEPKTTQGVQPNGNPRKEEDDD